ncbi:MAG: hypothetical protein Tsb0020_55370 [Haliangiales bacterium]
MSAFARASAALFADANLAADATYTPQGGSAATIRAIRTAPDAARDWNGGAIFSETVTFRIAVAEVPAPAAGDRIEAYGEARIVQGAPQRDVERLSWLIDTRPAPVDPASTFPMTFPITLA